MWQWGGAFVYVSSELLMALYNIAHREDYGLTNDWSNRQLKHKQKRWKQICISYLSCPLFNLVNSFRIKQDLSASPFTVLVNYQANLVQVKLRTWPTVDEKERKQLRYLQHLEWSRREKFPSQCACVHVRRLQVCRDSDLLRPGADRTPVDHTNIAGVHDKVWEDCFT